MIWLYIWLASFVGSFLAFLVLDYLDTKIHLPFLEYQFPWEYVFQMFVVAFIPILNVVWVIRYIYEGFWSRK